MANRRISPHTVEVLLKPADRTVACPEVDRCQLEMVKNDYPDILMVTQTPHADTQHVHVGLLATNGGCDYDCRVGLVAAGGPIAIGSSGGIWERGLLACRDMPDLLFDDPPERLLCARYVNNQGSPVSLVAAKIDDKHWCVIVTTQGGQTLRKNYTSQTATVYVSAALSQNGRYLFVAISETTNGVTTARYEWLTYAFGSWSAYQSGQILLPDGSPAMTRPIIVDRLGQARGLWGIQQTGRLVVYNEDGSCLAPQVIPGEVRSELYLDRTGVWGGYWDIAHGAAWHNGTIRCHGQVYAAGDLAPEYEVIVSPYSLPNQLEVYNWWGQPEPNAYTGTGYRQQTVQHTDRLEYDTAHSARRTKDYGEDELFNGSSEATATMDQSTGIITTVTRLDCSYTREIGTSIITVDPGGWVSYVEQSLSYRPTVPLHVETEITSMVWAGTWNQCPQMYSYVATGGMTTEATNTARVVYPVDLGDVGQVVQSFTAVDTVTGCFYCGARTRLLPDSPPVWHIYRDGINVTSEVAACIGRPLADLHAIYWRA